MINFIYLINLTIFMGMDLDEMSGLPSFGSGDIEIGKVRPHERATIGFNDGNTVDACVFGILHGHEDLCVLLYHPDISLMDQEVKLASVGMIETWLVASYDSERTRAQRAAAEATKAHGLASRFRQWAGSWIPPGYRSDSADSCGY